MKFDKAGQGLREAAKASGKIGASVRDVMNNTGKEDSDASDMTLSSFRKAQSDAQGAAREIFEAVRRRKVRSDIQKRTENEKVLLNTYRSTDSVDAAMNNAKAKAWRKSKDDKIVMEDRRQTTAARQSETGQADVSKGKAAADKKAASQVGAKDRKRNFAARLAARRAAKKSAEKAGTEIAKNAAKGAAAGTAKAAKKGIAAAITSNPVSLIILLIFAVIFIVVMMLTVSSFMGQASAMIAEQMGALQYLNTAVIAEILDKVNDEWYNELYRTRQQYSDMGVPYQNISVRYNHDVEGDSGGRRISNWSDVFAVWLIKNDRTITADDYTAIRDIYFAMNPITVTTEAVTDEELPEETPEEEVSPESPEPPEEETPIAPEDTLVYIDVRNLSYQQMAGIYNLSSADMAQIDE